ncbi:aminomethyl-transferring glycine dehydrogenase subunit GcvPA [Synergistaceae bacterium OttesenSCG-928-I11]|nr:aminomethyl-transferring glycine dehydrogenase subunit GcvPA [Synergistaceae bacterium OttesenSCG-928-I11]
MTHPYIPNSVPKIQEEMLREIGAKSIDEFFKCIPDDLQFKGRLAIPEPLLSEAALKRHVEGMADKNTPATRVVSFLGGGCWNHYVPASCDEINGRSEFLTAYAGDPYEDHGRFQALFEYASMMAELLEMDVVNIPTYDGAQAAGTALRMACRITERSRVLVPALMSPDRLKVIRTYLHPQIEVETIAADKENLTLDLADLKAKLNDKTAAVFIENPAFLGVIETQGEKISKLAHDAGALFVVWADPSSLGALTPPSGYGADIACGDIQPLGIHMHFGGGRGGYIASRDEAKYIEEYPSRLFGISPTTHGEWGFGDVAWERTSFAKREDAKEFVGTAAALWGITAGVYLATMGPQGMADLGNGIMKRARYLANALGKIKGVRVATNAPFFKEFPVTFEGKKVAEINEALLSRGIHGGHDLTPDYPNLKNSALYCVNETMTKADMDALVSALSEILKG